MARPFRHIAPPCRVYYGEDSLRQLASELDREGCRRAVVFCGRTLASHPKGLSLVSQALGERYAGAFDSVRTHSPLPQVVAGAEALRRLNADAVIALGGGSAVVTARASSILLAEGQDIHALCTRHAPGKPLESPRLTRPKLPQFVVPMTPRPGDNSCSVRCWPGKARTTCHRVQRRQSLTVSARASSSRTG